MEIASKVGLILSLFLHLSACATNSENTNQIDKPLVQPEYKLQEDRKALDEVRSQIPVDVQSENDELAFTEKLFSNPLKNPSEIRDQFSKALRKKRDKFQKDMQKRREVYVKNERTLRAQATKSFEKEREEFKKRKQDREASKEFYDSLDQKRKDFYADQKEKREEFEAQMRDDRKNFEDYTREKQNDFNAKLKEFTAKQKELQKYKK